MNHSKKRTSRSRGWLKPGVMLKIWSAGCSRGSEAYTLAIILDDLSKHPRHSILATDVDRLALAVAEAGGPYTPNEVRNAPAKIVEEYFTRVDKGYKFTGKIRQKIEFREHNLLADAYESGFDFILCRNTMIYFTPEARLQITKNFLKALKPGGLLLLGSTEALMPGDSEGFSRAGLSLYRKDATSLGSQSTGSAGLAKVS